MIKMNNNLKVGNVSAAICGLVVMGTSIFELGADILPIGIAVIFVLFAFCGCAMLFFGTKGIIWQLWKPKEE
jgi:hypothetical protein